MYKMSGRIRYSECGVDNRATVAAIINYFQDASSENSYRLGVGVEFLKKRKRAWVLNSWQVVVNRYPEMAEKIEVSTWATGFKGVFGPRNFCMTTLEGEVLAYANTLWVYVDTETGRPVKPEEADIAAYEVEEPLEMEAVSRKISMPEEMTTADVFPVRKYHLDTNHHVNNSQYIELAAEVLPEGFCVKKMRVEYKKPALLGEKMELKFSRENERIVAGLFDEEETPYAMVEFIGEN